MAILKVFEIPVLLIVMPYPKSTEKLIINLSDIDNLSLK